MRVAIAYNFNDRDWFGGRNYFASLFHAVEQAGAPDIEMVLVLGEKTQTSLPDEFPRLKVLKTALMDRMHPSWLLRQATLRIGDRDPLLARYLRSHAIDILSHSGYLGPRPGLRVLPWLYDFQFLHLPQYWSVKHIRWAKRRYHAACAQGDGVLVSSHNALADLERFAPGTRVPKHVLQFVSNPVDLKQLPTREGIRERYALAEHYFYLPNQFWENKNHRLAIDAVALLRDRGVDATVVCTGQTFDGRQPKYFDELMAYLESRQLGDRFRVLGVVPRADTQALMAHCTAVINPSRFEGWSTTVEEAKSMGVRLLLSGIDVHREQARETGRFFDVDQPGQLADALQACLLEPPPLRDPAELEVDHRRRMRAFGLRYVEILRTTMAAPGLGTRPS